MSISSSNPVFVLTAETKTDSPWTVLRSAWWFLFFLFWDKQA